MRGDVLAHVLSVKRQHPDLTASASQVVNDTQPAAFAAPRNRPSQLAHAAGARDYGAGFGMLIQVQLELRVFIVIEICSSAFVKKGVSMNSNIGTFYGIDV